MHVTIVISKNLLDNSRIEEVVRRLPDHIVTCSKVSRITNMLSAGPGDRKFTVIFDYYIYEKDGIDSFRNEINEVAEANGVDTITYKSFVPHEKLTELEKAHPDVSFIARSIFFLNPEKFLTEDQ